MPETHATSPDARGLGAKEGECQPACISAWISNLATEHIGLFVRPAVHWGRGKPKARILNKNTSPLLEVKRESGKVREFPWDRM